MAMSDHEPILLIALLAAMADGRLTDDERAQLQAIDAQLGGSTLEDASREIALGTVRLPEVAARLTSEAVRRDAFATALAICAHDGVTTPTERQFLNELRTALGLDPAGTGPIEQEAAHVAGAPIAGAAPAAVQDGPPPSVAGIDDLILQQAMLTGALELLPDKLANMAIIPLQLRLVYQIGQRHGQQLDAAQVKDLAGTFGIGAAAQVMEGVVRKVLRALGKGAFGGMVGGAAGLAAGAAVSFASTYALGHAAKQYYAQGRRLSAADLKALFARFQEEARTLFPRLEQEITQLSRTVDVRKVLG